MQDAVGRDSDPAADGDRPRRPELLIITGMSGAGRSTTGKALEDLGWYVVDNLPPQMLEPLAELAARAGLTIPRLAVVVDVRGRTFFAELTGALAALDTRHVSPRVLFLDATDEVLVRRFESVRRPHPLQGDDRIVDGIARERALTGELRARADVVVDSSSFNVHQLGAARRLALRGRARRGPARHRHELRLQVRHPRRRRARRRRPVHPQPALGTGPAPAHRSGRPRRRVRPGRRGRRARSSTATRPRWCPSSRATAARTSATPRSPSAAPAASTARSRWPRSSASACARAGVPVRVLHRDLGRE